MADASINFDALSYNSMRDDLVISEYGRSIHQMVDHCLSIADRDERSKCAAAIVSVMGSVVKQEGEKEEAAQKLWNNTSGYDTNRIINEAFLTSETYPNAWVDLVFIDDGTIYTSLYNGRVDKR